MVIKIKQLFIGDYVADAKKFPLSAIEYGGNPERLKKRLISIAKTEYDGSIARALQMHELFLQRLGFGRSKEIK